MKTSKRGGKKSMRQSKKKGPSLKKLMLGDREITQVKYINSGTYGQVFLVTDDISDGFSILKQINLKKVDKSMIPYVLQEADMLKKLQHKNIIGYKHGYFDKEQKMFYLLLEYANGGDLEELFRL